MTRRRLPRDSPNWLPLQPDAINYVLEITRSPTLAATDLNRVLGSGELPCLCRTKTGRAICPPREWADDLYVTVALTRSTIDGPIDGTKVGVFFRTSGLPSYGRWFFVWEPTLKKIFPSRTMPTQPQRETEKPPGRRGFPPVHDHALLGAVALAVASRDRLKGVRGDQSVVKRALQDWCILHGKEVPADSTLAKIAQAAMSVWKEFRSDKIR